MSTATSKPPIDIKTIIVAGVAAAIAAAVANVIVFLIASAGVELIVPNPRSGEMMPLTLVSVIMLSVVGLIGATVVFAIINRIAANPAPIFVVVSVIVLTLSFYLIFGSPTPIPGSTVPVLVIMHIVAAVVGVGVLVRLSQRSTTL